MEDMWCGMYSIKVTNGDHILNIIYVEQIPCEEIIQQCLMMAMIQPVIERNSPETIINFSRTIPRWG